MSRRPMALSAVAGLLWFAVRFIFRLYVQMLIEPTLNPLKLPIGILAAKFFALIPNYIFLMTPGTKAHEAMFENLAGWSGWAGAVALTYLFIVPTLWLLPSAVAFFIWEMLANWRLFRANRAAKLRPVIVGRHGEGVLQLLRLGTHSGTVPRLVAHLRRAGRAAYHSRRLRPAHP